MILWPDTWNNNFHPTTAIAAVEVLEDAGFQVTIPRAQLCCGRPLYDYGMLGAAKHLLLQTIEALREDIRAGVPLVGLEPSCVSVFRDEMVNLLGEDLDARRLRDQTFLFTEFLNRFAPNYTTPKLHGKAVVHQHCHHKSVLDKESESAVLQRTGVDFTILDDGCCGMAGAFGFEQDHYEVSMALGERALLPAVRNAETETILVADGFSCREQIAQSTNRLALHPAQLLKLAIERRGEPEQQPLPELRYMDDPRESARLASRAGAIGLAALGTLALAVVLVRFGKR